MLVSGYNSGIYLHLIDDFEGTNQLFLSTFKTHMNDADYIAVFQRILLPVAYEVIACKISNLNVICRSWRPIIHKGNIRMPCAELLRSIDVTLMKRILTITRTKAITIIQTQL